MGQVAVATQEVSVSGSHEEGCVAVVSQFVVVTKPLTSTTVKGSDAELTWIVEPRAGDVGKVVVSD